MKLTQGEISKNAKATPRDVKEFSFIQHFKIQQNVFEFSRAFIISDFCKFCDLFTAQFTFNKMFLIAFDKYFEPFSQIEAVSGEYLNFPALL